MRNFLQFEEQDSISNCRQNFWNLICTFHYGANQHPSMLTLQHTKYFSVIAEDAQHFFKTSRQFIFSLFPPCQKELQAVIRKSGCKNIFVDHFSEVVCYLMLFRPGSVILHYLGPAFQKCKWWFLWLYLKFWELSTCIDQATYVPCG